MQIITAGRRYIDIDSYAGIVAYAELLRLQGREAEAVSTAPPNESVPPSLRALPVRLKTDYKPAPEDRFTMIDVSYPDFFDAIVDLDKVTEIIDHHLGKEDYWRGRIGSGCQIEFVGAACTLVVEHWEKAGLLGKMEPSTAKLLACGILDNSLNFRAKITTARDRKAYQALAAHAALPDDWAEMYFRECKELVEHDIEAATRNDLKRFQYQTFTPEMSTSQIALWSAAGFAHEHRQLFKRELTKERPDWYMNLVDLKEGRSYFITDRPEVQKWLSQVLGVRFDGWVAKSDRAWLRKEITKADMEFERSGGPAR